MVGMTNKNSLYAVLVTALFAAIIAKMRAAMDRQVPLGYEDEEGFHYGVKSVADSDAQR
jgi:hypothetical protein